MSYYWNMVQPQLSVQAIALKRTRDISPTVCRILKDIADSQPSLGLNRPTAEPRSISIVVFIHGGQACKLGLMWTLSRTVCAAFVYNCGMMLLCPGRVGTPSKIVLNIRPVHNSIIYNWPRRVVRAINIILSAVYWKALTPDFAYQNISRIGTEISTPSAALIQDTPELLVKCTRQE